MVSPTSTTTYRPNWWFRRWRVYGSSSDWTTSGFADDVHRGAHENIYQGDLEIQYRFTDVRTLKFGCQRGGRKFSFEPNSVSNTNVWLSGEFRF